MKLSQYFLPTLKENPVDATIASHQLMIRAGMIRQSASGLYTWLPLGLRVLRKIESIIKKGMDESGAIEVLMPTIQPADLWIESGRYDAYGEEMLKIKDRNGRDLLYGPTHEEIITDVFRKNVTSYRDLPKNLYQINWKFRDEIRPRFGVMRAREFLMKDSYSFDIDEASSRATYDLMYRTYFKIFKSMGLNPIALRANTGAIGGELSHEFQILADTGESAIYYDSKLDELIASGDYDLAKMRDIYAMADEMHDEKNCPIPLERLQVKRGIEVGHIFNFGTKYSKALEASVLDQNGKKVYPQMGSYGIGVSRLVGAIIEANHDDNGIIWPKEIAPFAVALINLKPGDAKLDAWGEEIYQQLTKQGIEVLYDDTKISIGQKFAMQDLIGIPTQIVVGPKNLETKQVEIKNRRTGEKSVETLANFFS